MLHKFKLRPNPKCIFCGVSLTFSDAVDICHNHYEAFYAIPKLLRWLLPKFVIRHIILFTRKGGVR